MSSQPPAPGLDPADLRQQILRHVRLSLGREWGSLTPTELLAAVSLAVRDQVTERMLATERRWRDQRAKRVYYLSMEFLIGRSLGNNLRNLGLLETCREALAELSVDLDDVLEQELDAALGNGGLGRLAACFLDSMASLDIPGQGCGINYEYGLFRQSIENGYQKEQPDSWRADGTPWQFERPEQAIVVPLYGRMDDALGALGGHWLDWQVLVGVPHDMPVVGWQGRTVNRLRLYSARASTEFDMATFNEGDYHKAVAGKVESETISKVLYPPDGDEQGQELRLVQEYFFTSCAIQDAVRTYLAEHDDLLRLSEQVAIQLNDTHPALAVAELMRVLMDEHGLGWDESWGVTHACLAYTNHTLLPEALERWSIELIGRVLPRHLTLIEEIDRRFLAGVEARWPGDAGRLERMAIVDRSGERAEVRMAHLAVVGSHSVNGVARLHSELLTSRVMPDFDELWPQRFNNKTNGITQRRWLHGCNPELSALISECLGDEGWVTDLERLTELEEHLEDSSFRERFAAIKTANKRRLAALVGQAAHVTIDPEASLFDVQAKRIHEYKRQLLMALGIVHDYLALTEDGIVPLVPRSYLIAGKAAPGYWMAKQYIKLFNNLARTINADPRAAEHMRVAFVPDYRVSLAERLIPAADLSEQISTAGFEASGTGNMKFALNGALTIGTLDGANIEIREEVGTENLFIFGLRATEISELRDAGRYDSQEFHDRSPAIQRVLAALDGPLFSDGDAGQFSWIRQSLLGDGDYYFHLADMESYLVTQERVARTYLDRDAWVRKAILNTARVGRFSSDRTIREYATDIWGVPVAAPVRSA